MQHENEETLDDWFLNSVLPHEPALLRYLYRNWRENPSEVKDLCQEVLTRVYTAARQERPQQIKAFIFSTARNLMCDLARRAQVVRIDSVMDVESLNVPNDGVGPEGQFSARQELILLQAAMETLSSKCQRVIEMRRVYGYSQRETAKRLNISEAAVESHIQRGIQRLSNALQHISEIAASKCDAKGGYAAHKENKT